MIDNAAARVYDDCRRRCHYLTARCKRSEADDTGHWNSRECSTASLTSLSAEFHAGLKETSFVEGHAIEYRRAEAQYDGLPAFAAELVGRQVTVIVASGAAVSPLAAQAATKTIPIAFLKETIRSKPALLQA